MDQSGLPSLPRLNVEHARLAVQCRRVTQFVDDQLHRFRLDPAEQLFVAATRCDWSAAAQAAGRLARLPEDDQNRSLVRAAKEAERAVRGDDSCEAQPRRVKPHLGRLLAECRAAILADERRPGRGH